ncbi:MAG: bifunctional riboflavin kinase/FAD synthetase [Elusimicrobia bacterium]|nr:bifunctional riboflavin kinase/FAD synthetase [Elusimicrobiota bacterium]
MNEHNGCALTIGTFDGVHLGHLSLIKKLKEEASKLSVISKVLFFPIPPRFYITGKFEGNLITTSEERKKLLLKSGADKAEELIFDERIRNMSASEFFEKFILNKHKTKILAVGPDFALGKDREGGHSFLSAKCRENSIKFFHAESVKFDGHKISSTLIRSFIKNGEVEKASFCLGGPYFLSGRVIKGAGIGRKIGFPTANLQTDAHKILPLGIFAGRTFLRGKYFDCVISVGRRPTFKTLDMALLAEAHILDFSQDIYGEEIEIFFESKIRDEFKFSSKEELVTRIKEDIRLARITLKNRPFSFDKTAKNS